MSEYWTFRCNTCNITCNESANRLSSVLLTILRNTDNFKQIKDSDKDGYIEFGIMAHSPQLIYFVIEHYAHNVVVLSETGDYINRYGVKYNKNDKLIN